MFKILNTKFVRSAPVVAAIWLSLTAGIIIEFNKNAFECNKHSVIELANSEGLFSHAKSIEIR